MSRVGLWVLPVLAAALVAFAQTQWYADVMAKATAWTLEWAPAQPPPTDVQVRGDRLRVLGAAQPTFVNVPAIGWNLPVLVCLWGWVVRRRWLWLLVASVLLVCTHVLVTDFAIRRGLGDLPGFANSIYRAWFIWIAPLLPVVLVALGRFMGSATKEEVVA